MFYTLFTNELPEIIHDHPSTEEGTFPNYNTSCTTCGNVVCFADDTTFSCSSNDPNTLSEELSAKFKLISAFLVSNRLKLNDDKTPLLVLTTSQARRRSGADHVQISTTNADIVP